MLSCLSFLRLRRNQTIPTILERLASAIILVLACTRAAYAVSCQVVPAHAISEAEQAYQNGKYDRAATLYQAQLDGKPNDPALTVGLVEALLRQEKVKDADDAVQKALAQNPNSVELLTALGEVQFREGTLWLAGPTVGKALKIDPCYPQLHLLSARLLRVNSMYGTSAREIKLAHQLDPNDPRIRLRWLQTLPRQQRISELEGYISAQKDDDTEAGKDLRNYLGDLKKQASEPHKSCHLASTETSTSVNFTQMMEDANRMIGFGLDVKINDRNARLQIDTGASGLLISRSVADRAGLKKLQAGQVGGIGDDGAKSSYTAYADVIRMGGLEFRDCQVEVTEKHSAMDTDGLIGMDVFSHFLVTLDYPMRKLLLDPLPPRPGEDVAANSSLDTASSAQLGDDADNEDAPPASDPSKSPAATVRSGPQDRYVAPAMKDWTPVYRIGHLLMIPASMNDSPLKLFVMDTGAFSTTVSPTAAREVTKVSRNGMVGVEGISGKVDKVYTTDRIVFKFANLSQTSNQVVAFENPFISRGLGTEISGFLGIKTLGQMTVKIDYRDGLVNFHYDPNRGFKYPTNAQ